jgi:hypothetical protein
MRYFLTFRQKNANLNYNQFFGSPISGLTLSNFVPVFTNFRLTPYALCLTPYALRLTPYAEARRETNSFSDVV